MWDYKIKIDTPENTEIEFELAGIGCRFIAMLMDYFITFLITVIFYLVFGILAILFDNIIANLGEYIIAIIMFGIFLINFSGYFILFEYIWSGQTPGKRLAGIRVIKENGQPPNFFEIFIRNILRVIDIVVGPYFILFSNKEKRLGDFIVQTIVVKEKEVSIPIVETVIDYESNHNIPNVSKITPKDFTLIGNFLKREISFDKDAKNNLLNEFLIYYIVKLSLEDIMNVDNLANISYKEKISLLTDIFNAYKQRGVMA